ncbi:MAG TPA: outer membrane beta-barrel protein [Puia sp.]|nr:outer membrane beta-barrel protein [Puia sp.]
MRNLFVLLFLLSILQQNASGQKSFEIIASLGRTYTPSIAYQNCTGHIDPSFTPSISFLYHPHPSWGFEIAYSGSKPNSWLNDPNNNSVSTYTYSTINMQRLLAGINYSPRLKAIHPFIGCLIGFTHTVTTQTPMTASKTGFSWACQGGVAYYFSSVIGLRLDAAFISTPNISNNSAYFNVDKNGAGFPSFAVGDPSEANIVQWNISLGMIVRFMKTKK